MEGEVTKYQEKVGRDFGLIRRAKKVSARSRRRLEPGRSGEENKHEWANREERVVRWMFVLLLLRRDAGAACTRRGANRAAPRKNPNVAED